MTELVTLAGRYKLIYLDPAWNYWGDSDKDQAAGKHYNTMTYEELVKLPVRSLIDDPGVIFMWATGPKMDEAVDLIRAWDFYYRGIGYLWIKTTKDGRVISGQGVRPSFVKPTTELVLVGSTEPKEAEETAEMVIIGSTQAKGRTLPLKTEKQSQLIFAPRPPKHSEKPSEARERIEELFGNVPRIELFARRKHQGWDSWGLEANGPMSAVQAVSPKLRKQLEELEANQRVMSLIEDLPQE
jgi:N6-adenosine-specific RNA methylase IME4